MPSTKVSTVRLTQVTYQRLHALMKKTDRTRSQLVRYSLDYFLTAGVTPTTAISTLSEHISIRLPEDVQDAITKVANKHDVSPSDVLRCAIDVYVDLDNKHLGQGVGTNG